MLACAWVGCYLLSHANLLGTTSVNRMVVPPPTTLTVPQGVIGSHGLLSIHDEVHPSALSLWMQWSCHAQETSFCGTPPHRQALTFFFFSVPSFAVLFNVWKGWCICPAYVFVSHNYLPLYFDQLSLCMSIHTLWFEDSLKKAERYSNPWV